MWFIFALLTVLAWGSADLFYKKSADGSDRYSHLKTSVAVGAVMGVHALIMLAVGGFDYNPLNLLIYLPVSAMYILSMTVGYLGLRFLELSVASPVQNSSGALVCVMCLVFLGDRLDLLSAVGVGAVSVGLIALGVLEKKKPHAPADDKDKKYRVGFAAFLIPLIYCALDALGTFLDAYYLDDYRTTPLVGVSEANFENTANISYELTFAIAALALFVFVKFVKKQSFRPRAQKTRVAAALLETGGQFAYVFAMSGNGAVAAPMIAAYSIVSIVLSRVFLRERLTRRQYFAIALVMAGIIALGLSEGFAGE